MIPKSKRIEWGNMGAKAKWDKEPPYSERFWSHVKIGAKDECWPWLGCRFKQSGYGKYKLNGSAITAHRIAYRLFYGVDPGRFHVLHDCDNRPCCNPHHLYAGTISDNNADTARRGRSCSGEKWWKTHPIPPWKFITR